MKTQVCIAGGGPAGMMLGYLLARSGIEVVVLEKHVDFFRDFRGDTIHPSTLENLFELGLLEEFLKLPHQQVDQLRGNVFGRQIKLADFSHLKVKCPFIAFVPQWDFLNFLAQKSRAFPNFTLIMQTEVLDLKKNNDSVCGVVARSQGEIIEINADLVVGADGRESTVRELSQLPLKKFGTPIDVLWFRVSHLPTDGHETLGRIEAGRMMVMIYRETYWQCGFVIKKGEAKTIKERGLDFFHNELLKLAPFLKERVYEVTNLNDLKLLSVRVDRLLRWHRPGLICIGDAAHAMSPIGGVGINLAIQDAVASANIIVPILKQRDLNDHDLAAIQKRRMWPTQVTQRLQIAIQNRIINRVIDQDKQHRFPIFLKLFLALPPIQRVPGRMIGLGIRPEHIKI